MLSVLHLASGDLWAGAEVMLHAVATAQKALPEVQVRVVLLNEGRLADELRGAGVEVHVFPESSLNVLQIAWRLRALALGARVDVIHTHRIKEDLIGALVSLMRGGAVCVRTVHGVDETERTGLSTRQKLERVVHEALVKRTFAVTFVVAQSLVAVLAKDYGAGRVRYVANGIDVAALRPCARPASGATNDPVRIGIAGRLVPIKRVDLFLRMAAELQRQAPGRCHFEIFGDGAEAESLHLLATSLRIEPHVTFHGFQSNMSQALPRLDMLYMTSDSEGLPMVLLEAMALNVPVVAHAVGEIPEVLARGACGTLVEHHHEQGYARPALDYLRDPGPFHALARAAMARVEEIYSSRATARAYLEEYRRAMKNGPSAHRANGPS